ncbi:lactoferrin/transferrin family TonB-dependent receptor [Wielerella bovis]|uniref:lactoferrin/transferrin family TonB-dependent receptor n=1 Tax=Wielerella bovis TaxID=2917790 RepID=UPI002019E57B|nr:lactoferrin/transferrin family TonB-dependent receptor [Wielerella bovis]MCG7657224.1 lactoferrin/transferrin family TonB-dependent receptor [Wielerella bovis]MCG7659446.1 lactoferrin/transferrin family TonB-dependent receptor [Wielerella bovis]
MSTKSLFQFKLIVLAVSTILSSNYASATNKTSTDEEITQELETIHVQAKRRISKRQNEVTGLGKVVKSSEDIDKELILNIRDLTRYDPGISVVEQGRGATSGYAMRGVDKNRVAMLVDGLGQAQSYATLKSDANGGAINEIEYENIKSIELSKGSSSAEYGSGALGGAVGFRTKEANDVIKQGQNWGLDSKTAYSSKNSQLTQSVAGAFRIGSFDSLAILTHRTGKETSVHSAAEDVQHTYRPLEGYFNEYDVRLGLPSGTRSQTYYIIADECPTLSLSCRRAKASVNHINQQPRLGLSPEEQAQADKMPYPVRTANAKDYTGPDRISPNPMDYKSRSFFWKGGYRFLPNHYVGGVLEYTKQHYDTRDMTQRAYYTREDICPTSSSCQTLDKNGHGNGGMTATNNPLDGLVFDAGNQYRGVRYTRGKFFDEHHNKNRIGLFYRYQNPEKNTWVDKFTASFDRQDLKLASRIHRTNCTDYPKAERCRASLDKPWSNYSTEKNDYQEILNLAQFNWEKAFRLGFTAHKLSIAAGFGNHRSTMKHGDIYSEYTKMPAYIHKSGRGTYDDPHIYERENILPTLVQINGCNNNAGDNRDCTPRVITGKQHYISLRDHIAFGKYADLGLGVRHDSHSFRSSDPWIKSGSYRNWSWNAGLSLKPSEYLTLSYRVSNGFRVPAFYELYGIRTGASEKNNPYTQADFLNRKPLKAEKAFNQEIGLAIKGDFGVIETSVFQNDYKNLLARADKRFPQLGYVADFYNTQDVKLNGINILGKIDWAGISNRLPEGLYSNFAYNRVKIKERKLHEGYINVSEPTMEAVQPGRFVAGIGYDQPEGKWGFNLSGTYSKAKRNDELTGSKIYGGGNIVQIAGKRTRAWYIYDLTAYYNLRQKFTLRSGIYNLTNRKYSTWENVRQSSANAVNQDQSIRSARYAAPGRNFTVSLEMKF